MSSSAFLKASEVAAMLGISKRLVYDLAARGDLPSHRLGDAVRFDISDVESYKTKCRSVGTPVTNAGALSSTASLKVVGTELAAFFRKAGVRPRPTPSTAKKAGASMPLALVSSEPTN